tara:strand:+ start:146 stop:640 length:495 start_codon:yes stop_codon:yes gene_type:complete
MDKFKDDKERLDELLVPRIQKEQEERERGRRSRDDTVKRLSEFIEKEDIEERLISISNHFIEKSQNKWKIVTKEIKPTYQIGFWDVGYDFTLKSKKFFFPKMIKIRIRAHQRNDIDRATGALKPFHVATWAINDGKLYRDGEGADQLFRTLNSVLADAIDNVYR